MKIPTVARYKQNFPGGPYVPLVSHNGKLVEVGFAAFPGSQTAFLACPTQICLLHGNRGGGKTYVLLADFAQHVGQGFGAAHKGILFRPTMQEFKEVKAIARDLFPRIHPGSTFNEMQSFWEFPDGARLYFSYFESVADYDRYHGQAYTWIGWEELTSWASPDCFLKAMSLLRSTHPGIVKKVRATCNPGGEGSSWVRDFFQLYGEEMPMIGALIIDETTGMERRAIRSQLAENVISISQDPNYMKRILASVAGDEDLKKAWAFGSWAIASGGIYGDVWHAANKYCVVPPFKVPPQWKIYISYDHGQSKPFSVGWYAVSDGCELHFPDGTFMPTNKGDVFRVYEWYGAQAGTTDTGLWLSTPEIAKGIKQRTQLNGWEKQIKGAVADSAIMHEVERDRPSVAQDFYKAGIDFAGADKSPGSRVEGVQQIRKRLAATIPIDGFREHPGLFISAVCENFLKIFPTLPRDRNNKDDVSGRAPDHLSDELRYFLRMDITPNVRFRRVGKGSA